MILVTGATGMVGAHLLLKLLEKGQQVGFDKYVPGHGMLVYHVDENYIADNSYSINASSYQGMYIVPANSTAENGIEASPSSTNTTGCPYPGTGVRTSFTDTTIPNSRSWAGENTEKPITAISENTVNKTITFNFMGGNTCTPPVTQATSFSATSIEDNAMTVNWTRGNGTSVIVVARASAEVDTDPVNNVQYTADVNYGNGSEIGSGNFVVYAGTGSSVNVKNLIAGTPYYFAVYENNSATNCYKIPGLTGSATTSGLPPCTACVPASESDDGTGITSVSFNTINNASLGDPAYTDFKSISTTVIRNQAYLLSVKINTDGGYTDYTKAWIDWNHDCTFDISEEYDLGDVTNVADGLTSLSPLSITVPATALTGNTLMRVRNTWSADPTACGSQSYSEAEDYILVVEAAPICEPTISIALTAGSNPMCAGASATFTATSTNGGTLPTFRWQVDGSDVATGNTYMTSLLTDGQVVNCILTSNAECASPTTKTSDGITMTVTPLPAEAGIITGATTVCQGQTAVSYSVPEIENATGYTWLLPLGVNITGGENTNSIAVSYSDVAGSGNISVKGMNSCGDGPVASLAVMVNLKPESPIITMNGNALHSDVVNGNQWYNQDGIISEAVGQDYIPVTNGDYYAVVTLKGCESDASNVMSVEITGINSDDNTKSFAIYPNPVTNELIIEIKGNVSDRKFEIVNSMGQVVCNGVVNSRKVLQTDMFAPGIYFLKLENEKSFENKKFIKE